MSLNGTVNKAYKDVTKFRTTNPKGRIVVLGYSAGGDDAVALANKLGKNHITVDSMITFDPHQKNWIGYKDYKLTEGNVENGLNFYQRNEYVPGTNPFRGSPVDGLTNIDLTGEQTDHVTIVTDSLKHHGEEINAVLNSN